MDAPDPPSPYQLVYSDAVKLRLHELFELAFTRGDGAAFTAALKEFDRLLRLYPQFGDTQIDLKGESGIIYNGIIPPLCLRYGVDEERRLVLVVATPVLMPMARPDAQENE